MPWRACGCDASSCVVEVDVRAERLADLRARKPTILQETGLFCLPGVALGQVTAELLLAHGADINTSWSSHEPASILHELVWHKDYQAMQFLIDRGIDMTIRDFRWGGTAQGWAAVAAQDETMAQWLAEARADLSFPLATGNGSPLLSTTLPTDKGLIGLLLYAQYASVDKTVNALGISMTGGLKITIGD